MAGRPRKIKTAEEFKALVEGYFRERDAKLADGLSLYTIGGLALHCGYSSMEDLKAQAERGGEFSAVLKKAIATVAANVEERLFTMRNPAGAIFWLKNHGWADNKTISGPEGGPIVLKVTYVSPAGAGKIKTEKAIG